MPGGLGLEALRLEPEKISAKDIMCELSREVEKHSGQAFCRKEMSMDFPYEFISSKLQS